MFAAPEMALAALSLPLKAWNSAPVYCNAICLGRGPVGKRLKRAARVG